MYNDTLFSALRQVGFTGQEASLYVTLCLHGALTGYEAAKFSGISRSNAYAGLGSLVEKGGAVVAQGKPLKYVPVSPEELITRLEHKYAIIFKFLRENLPGRLLPQEPYLTLSGTANIEAKIRDMLRNARLRVYLSLTAPFLLIFEKELAECVARGLRVVLLSDAPPVMRGVEWYVGDLTQGQIKLIVDTKELIFGSFMPSGQSNCLYSVNEQLVQFVREALINEIKLMRPGLSGK